ncbi:hypothetical protein CASFOL_027802 [Castilleja foliolosa]|uniref:F-box domain-containing protein n=1 Tax=Castilleja foliolosa TaxID=1961234 RepID=A0ABD3CHF6_9LAMI
MDGCVFHQDIMLCILTRLPVKSIIRFKSVCKPWRDLFSSPEFIKMHQGQFSSNSRNQCLIMENRVFIDSRADDEFVDSGRVFSLLKIESDEERAVHRSPETENMNIVGCCNGLICMGNPHEQESIVFWNPAINLFKFVSISEIVGFTDPYRRLSIGFGYDAEGDDFKAVIISCLNGKNKSFGVEVYSVNSESWITVELGFQINGCSAKNVAIVNGNPYWAATVDENQSAKSRHVGDVLVCFNVRKMEFKVVPVPASSRAKSPIYHVWNVTCVWVDWKGALVDWKGSLGALVCTKGNDERVESLDVLVYDDVEQFWRKEHTFGLIEVSLGQILDISKNGKILGRCLTGELIGFDPETGWVKVYDVQPSSYWYLYLYTESLTYIKGMRPVFASEHGKEE